MKPDPADTFRKIHAYALATDSGFGTLGVFINGDGKPRIGIIAFHPQGTDLYLTAEEAELWLSGYVTGRNGGQPQPQDHC